jgi:MoxR-like ATPase
MTTGEGQVFPSPDRGDGRIYVLTSEIDEAVDVALATGRPLLLRGRPGSGKSSLAPFVAYQRGWRYYEYVVSHRTQPQDLLWHYDSVRRLADAQASVNGDERPDDATYVRPGILWWALAPGSAGSQGRGGGADPFAHINGDRDQDRAVVLIDEIDKAEPDVPNSLLVPLGSYRFTVTQTGAEVRAEPPRGPADQRFTRHLVVITTNEERELPQAFLRRCVVLTLPDHDEEGLLRIAEEHMGDWHGTVSAPNRQLAGALAAELGTVRAQAAAMGVRGPSTAEYLDALRACITLDIRLGTQRWEWLRDCVLLKRQQMAEDDW